mmetsp:Transcript_77717/g.161495  ORF Transcript_77717/g.161495 Transcript_77717/m.161495 type:complete len:368 (-) Transcript_77717:26-1129(-)|eukprot:CAMPEP_0206430828 /NCGR_PEP_ID=MMETSP0324_2-20121206/7031_1 /ASSEMBLY_ACC=CAM_ASM_000836 /TAXON_ID=2866 /ORGANISM="Crypthecodinium cohnii, Strain Seligo" /LENGTH=367 /DNA_ID=CAMNT_0053896699 /DNA_START=239 /DNA_END=1342 /DNA_ORIENTATION=+
MAITSTSLAVMNTFLTVVTADHEGSARRSKSWPRIVGRSITILGHSELVAALETEAPPTEAVERNSVCKRNIPDEPNARQMVGPSSTSTFDTDSDHISMSQTCSSMTPQASQGPGHGPSPWWWSAAGGGGGGAHHLHSMHHPSASFVTEKPIWGPCAGAFDSYPLERTGPAMLHQPSPVFATAAAAANSPTTFQPIQHTFPLSTQPEFQPLQFRDHPSFHPISNFSPTEQIHQHVRTVAGTGLEGLEEQVYLTPLAEQKQEQQQQPQQQEADGQQEEKQDKQEEQENDQDQDGETKASTKLKSSAQRPSKTTRMKCKAIAQKAIDTAMESGTPDAIQALINLAAQTPYMKSLLRHSLEHFQVDESTK